MGKGFPYSNSNKLNGDPESEYKFDLKGYSEQSGKVILPQLREIL